MKAALTSFLVFCLLSLLSYTSNAQETDSLSYYSNKISNPLKTDDLASAYQFFTQLKIDNSKKKKDRTRFIYAIQNLARIQMRLGYTSESELLHLECLDLLAKLENKTDWTKVCYTTSFGELAKIYRERKDYSQSLALYDEALTTASLPADRAVLLNNKGYVYEFKNELETALSFYKAAYNKALETTNTVEIARTLSNLSFIQSQLHIPNAEKGLLEALDLRLKDQYPNGMISSYNHLTRFYKEAKDSLNMKKYSDKFLETARITKFPEHLESALRLKVETGETEYALSYIRLNDSLNDMEEEQRNNFNYYVYQYDKKEKDLKNSQLDNERLLYLLLFIALASLSIYFILSYKHKKEKLQEVYNTETRISRKIHDEVANDVYHVMTQLQTGSNSNIELLDHLENIYKRTRDISKQNSSIDLNIPYTELLSDLLLSYKNEHVTIITKGLQLMDWKNLKNIQKAAVYRVLQELLTNMRKHSEASFVFINFSSTGNSISINYKDNGVGAHLIKGNGLQNMENRVHSINGSITFESEIGNGFKSIIRI
jgi:signal transduction histidine kinase